MFAIAPADSIGTSATLALVLRGMKSRIRVRYFSEIGTTTSSACTCLDWIACVTSIGRRSRKRVRARSRSYSLVMTETTCWLTAAPITPTVLPLISSMLVTVLPGGAISSTTALRDDHHRTGLRKVPDVGAHHGKIGFARGKGIGGIERGHLVDDLEPHRGVGGVQPARDRLHQLRRVAVKRACRDRQCGRLRGIAIGDEARTAGNRHKAQDHRDPHPARRPPRGDGGDDRKHARACRGARGKVLVLVA